MGKYLPPSANPATGKPPTGDQATEVVSGQFTALGQVSQPFCIFGQFNVTMNPTVTDALTTQAGSTNATFATGTGLAAGQNIQSTLVPPGTVISSLTVQLGGVTTVTLGGLTAAQIAAIAAGTDANATVAGGGTGATMTIDLERSFDGGSTWATAGVGGGGTAASYAFGAAAITTPVSFVAGEPEKGVAYRLNCRVYASGTMNYRISTTGLAAQTWGVPV